jgi:hypothetical protein
MPADASSFPEIGLNFIETSTSSMAAPARPVSWPTAPSFLL